MIDFGLVTKLPRIGQDNKKEKKNFRGNLLNASIDALKTGRSSAIDDIFSLLCVAFFFVFLDLPWLRKLDKILQKNGVLLDSEEINKLLIELRKKYH